MVKVKRVYELASPEDGVRVLVDRLWPRGMTKERAHIDLWLRELAPTAELRKWFGHDREKWAVFRQRYFRELDSHPEEIERLLAQLAKGPVTLLYGAKDQDHNGALALKEYLLASSLGPHQ